MNIHTSIHHIHPDGRCSISQVYPHTRCVCICMRLFYFLSLLNLWDWWVSVSHDSGKVDLPTALISCSLDAVVLLSPPLTKYFLWCLHNVVNVLACIIILRQCLTLQGLQGATPVPTFCPCGFVPSCAYMCLGLCLFLVRWSVICCQDGCLMAFAKGALPEDYLSHNFDEQCLGGH